MKEIACGDCVISTFLTLPPAQNSEVSSEVSDGVLEAIHLLSSRGIVAPLRFLSS